MNRPDLATEVKKNYKLTFDVTVNHDVIDNNDYEITIIGNGKIVVLSEHMRRGLTKHVVLTTDKSSIYKKYYEAEADAIAYLKG